MSVTWTGRRGWSLTHEVDRLTVTDRQRSETFLGAEAHRLAVKRGWFRSKLVVSGPQPWSLKGLTRRTTREIDSAISVVVARSKVEGDLKLAIERRDQLDRLIDEYRADMRWIPFDSVEQVIAGLPGKESVLSALAAPERAALAHDLTADERRALAFLGEDHQGRIAGINDEIRCTELQLRRSFFDRVEKSPLTEEQASAVVTLDNRVRVIAAAGSGKTSVMVARAAYAIERGFVPADRILMLAFNADAAKELNERVRARLGALNLSSEGLQASTFHAFGLSLIGRATGRKPRIASWVENGQDAAKIERIVDDLRDASADFRFKWDVFRLLYGRMSDEPDGGEPDSCDRSTRRTGFQTYNGETVRSEGERLIADWLFLNGVVYEYEQPYSHDVADHEHGQYRPDFYYPDADVWHEHWAIRADGTAPEAFVGYTDSMHWKKAVHRRYGTSLVETEWHEIIDLSGFADLAKELQGHGLEFDWNPERPIPGAKPLEHERVARLVRTFMSHVKSGGLTRQILAARLAQLPAHRASRTRLFLDIYWAIHDRWEADLRGADAVDFDDMILHAANLLERDPSLARHDLVMVDEFQDTSRARARLVKALTHGQAKYLLAVGDDWQAINRFAGADLSVMADFAETFGPEQTCRLQTTFRCPQTIADVASRFVSRNPAQIRKSVVADCGPGGPPVTIVRVDNRDAIPAALDEHFAYLASEDPGSSVDVLGRYRFERQLMPSTRHDQLQIAFRTAHSAKGLEADYVVLPNLTTGTYGFPSQISDDPVLRLAMSENDDFPHSEERRLFYVALTRARYAVTIITVTGLESPFVVELLKDPDVTIDSSRASTAEIRACPLCGEGTLVRRTGPYGEFLGCSRFPKCRHSARL